MNAAVYKGNTADIGKIDLEAPDTDDQLGVNISRTKYPQNRKSQALVALVCLGAVIPATSGIAHTQNKNGEIDHQDVTSGPLISRASKGEFTYKPFTDPGDVIMDFKNPMGTGITFKVPMPQSIATDHGGGEAVKEKWARATHVGVEPLRVVSDYHTLSPGSIRMDQGLIDESDLWRNLRRGMFLSYCEDSWVLAIPNDETETSDTVTGFAHSGYLQSEKPIPFVRVAEMLEPLPWDSEPEGTMAYPQGPDSRQRIQAALDRVAALEPDESGFRGAVFLSKGTYYLSGSLTIKSGVVLRGKGRRNFGSILIFNHPQGVGITLGSEDDFADHELSSMMGVEGLRITSNYDTAAASQANSPEGPGGAADAGNINIGIRVLKTKNAWVRGVRVLHACNSAVNVEDSRHVTVRDTTSLEPISINGGGEDTPFGSKDSSRILFYQCSSEEGRHDSVIEDRFIQMTASPEELADLFEQQLSKRIGERQAALVLAETLSKASLPMEVRFPRSVVDGVIQGPSTKEQLAFEAADQRSWKPVMTDDGTGDWRKQWFLDGEGQSSVSNSPEGMELKASEGHMVLWTKESFEGDLKIEYTFTRTDNGGGVCIIYIQGTGRGDAGYETDITEWNDSREDANMGKYFQNMNVYHVSYACGYVRGRRYNPEARGLNTFSELTPEYLVDHQDFFEIGVPYRITLIKSDQEIRMRAVGPEKALYFMLDNERWAPVTEGRIGLRQMRSRESIYKDFRISVPNQ